MRTKGINWFAVIILIAMPATVGAWSAGNWNMPNHHGKFAIGAEQCVPLPKPPQKRCENPVDYGFLYKALENGSAEPDRPQNSGGDGLSSPKHSFNPMYSKTWDLEIKAALNLPNAQINEGDAITTIYGEKGEIQKTKDILQPLGCSSDQAKFIELWRQFGRLSHYPADLASPFHAYSVGIDGDYHEGDMNSDYDWYKGLWDLPRGRAMHGALEVTMGNAVNFTSLGCSSKAPAEVAQEARSIMTAYDSITPFSNKTGYEGLIDDFFALSLPADPFFFQRIGQEQAKDALGGICSTWKEALTGFTPPSNCDGPVGGCGDCGGGACPPPSGDHPDDNFSVSASATPQTSDELLEQAWDRMAVKKDGKSLVWFWMQSYLNGEYRLGNMDEAAYKIRSESDDLTSEVAWEHFYNDYITAPDAAVLGRGFGLALSDLLQNSFNEPVRRFTVEDFSPDALKDYPMLLIPSAGLMGLDESEVFKAKLAEYVKQGGTRS